MRFNHNTSLKGIIKRDKALPPGYTEDDLRDFKIVEEPSGEGENVFEMTQGNEIQEVKVAKRKEEADLDVKLGGALKLLEKVFNYPDIDPNTKVEDLQRLQS